MRGGMSLTRVRKLTPDYKRRQQQQHLAHTYKIIYLTAQQLLNNKGRYPNVLMQYNITVFFILTVVGSAQFVEEEVLEL